MTILVGVVLSTLAAGAFFSTLGQSLLAVLVGLALTLLFAFFFTSVAANAIATTARNPISGMTMLTIIVSSVVLLRFGVSGTTGMFFVMAIAGVVCTALSISGQFVTDLKTGYWLGSTPAAQQKVKFLGIVAAAIAAGLTIVMLARAFQFGEAAPGDLRVVLPAPQASIMKSLVEGFMSQQPVAYILFGAGAVIAVIMEMLGVPALIFALGMYLPLELNTPGARGRLPRPLPEQEGRGDRRRARRLDPRARDRHRLGPHGRRRPRRRLRRGAAAHPRLHRGLAEEPLLRQRGRLADGVGGPLRRPLPLRLVRFRPQDPGGLTHDPREARVDLGHGRRCR